MLQENIYKDWWGQQSVKEASNQQKLYTVLLAFPRLFTRDLVCINTSTCFGGMQFTALPIPNASVNIIDVGSFSVFMIIIFSKAVHFSRKCGKNFSRNDAIAEGPIVVLKMLQSDWYCIYACSLHKCKY